MKALLPYQQKLTWFFSLIVIWGMLLLEYARILPSLGMIGLLLSAILTTPPQELLSRLWKRKAFFFLAFSYLFLLTSFFYSENSAYLGERLQVKLPLLVLPLAFASLQPLSSKAYRSLLYLFVHSVGLIALGCFIYFVLNYQEITASYIHSKVIPGPINHVRFSLMIAFSIITGGWLFLERFQLKYNWERVALGSMTVFLFIFLHIYSVRSGMLAFYFAMGILLVLFIIRKKAYTKGLIGLGLLVCIPLVAYWVSPTLQNKVQNTVNDLQRYQNGEDPDEYPIAMRFISYDVAFNIYQVAPVLGCGLGDLNDEIQKQYLTHYNGIISPKNRIIPHNQFIFYLAATGLIGVLVFSFSFFFPLFYRKGYLDPILLSHFLIVFISLLFEATLENQLGVAFVTLFIVLPVNQLSQNSSAIDSA